MELSREILCEISVTSKDLKLESIQKLLVLVKDTKSNLSKEFWEEVALKLWDNLENGLKNMDDQLLCATCFYSVITVADKEDYYLDKILDIISLRPSSSSQVCEGVRDQENERLELNQPINTLQIVSLMYGMFQSSFLIQNKNCNTATLAAVLKQCFNVLLKMGYEYSQYAFLVFKTIKSFKKLCGGPLEKYIFYKENQLKLLALVNHNWENAITGVRDLNRSIFRMVISTLDHVTYEQVLKDIDGFYWNKAKFLMLSEVIESYKGDIRTLLHGKLVKGLIYSLHKPGLVSAGADMYYSLLKKIDNQNDWSALFLQDIITLLNSDSMKGIENFTNYWCLTTMKKFNSLIQLLIDELDKLENSEQLLYSKLCIIKQAYKLGIIDKNENLPSLTDTALGQSTEKIMLSLIGHCNAHVRILAFDIVCVSEGKSIPSQLGYHLIFSYLHDNVNSDNTVLRLSMFSSFNTFLMQLHFTFLNVMIKNNNSESLTALSTFCQDLQCFIKSNLRISGNYQRKITSIKLCNSILTNFSEIPKKRKAQTKKADITLIKYLKECRSWYLSNQGFIGELISLLKDPSDDIRDNVLNILLNHYDSDLQELIIMSHVITEAKRTMQSKFFYEISCGQSMFKLITNIFIKGQKPNNGEYNKVEDVFNYAFDNLTTQHARGTNVLVSIETGKQLHSFISILIVVLEECIANSYNIKIDDRMYELLNVLESISNQFAWEEEGSCDFSKINDMVQNIIHSSHYNATDQDDHTKISGQQQIVLNCLWLNVKASCDLTSILVRYNENNLSMCEKCLNIITRVLETSRHKGAIEAAGAALGRAIQYLTSLPDKRKDKAIEENDVSKLPFTLLERKLNDLISETNKMSSITRRGAGLSIMVHRIVSSDMKKGKPLFHYFIKTLLKTCNSKVTTCTVSDMDNQVDLPKAIYIHFMTRTVTDSSLATDMMYYYVELAELAFRNLTSPHWQIRNAALQLYGALIPRLIGQKKASGTDEETIATVSCDELRTHLPKLWQYIIEQIKDNRGIDTIQKHSNLVPILNLLASSAKRYNFSLHSEDEVQFYGLFNHLIVLLGSPIYTVRRLTARTIFNLYMFEFISNGILNQENITENLLHGILILINICYKYYNSELIFNDAFIKLRDKFRQIFSKGTHSYLCKKLFEDTYIEDIDVMDVQNTLLEINRNKSPGIQNWAEARLKRYISRCAWEDLPIISSMLLERYDYEIYCESILSKLDTQHNVSIEVLKSVTNIFITCGKTKHSSIIWQILYQLSQKVKLNEFINIDDIMQNLDKKVPYNLRYMIALVARNIGNVSVENKTRFMNIIEELSDFENSDVDMRYIAAIANNELAEQFNNIPDTLRVVSLKCVIMLLQDEDEDVRNLSAKFHSILCKDSEVFQPYISLNKILKKCFLDTLFDEPQSSIQVLSTKLYDLISNSKHIVDEYNPFANDSKNIYFEPYVLRQLVYILVATVHPNCFSSRLNK